MVRPISKVTAGNFYTVKNYFQTLLERQGLFGKYSGLQEQKAEEEAKFAFNNLPQPAYSSRDPKIEEDSEKIAIEALQAWIERYATHQWPKFLAVVRQRKFKKKNRMMALELRNQAYMQLKWYAKKMGLGLSDAVERLAKTELDRLTNEEWEKEQARTEQAKRERK